MTHSPATVIAEYLLTESLSSIEAPPFVVPAPSTDWCLYISLLPETNPARAGAVYDTTPQRLRRLLSGEELWAHGIQIKIRSSDYPSGWDKGEEVVALLNTINRSLVFLSPASYEIEYFSQTSRLLSLGQDAQRRHEFAINGMCVISQIT